MKTSFCLLAIACAFAIAVVGRPVPEAPLLACSADQPVVTQGQSVLLNAWASAPAAQALVYKWTADVGRINGSGHEVHWEFAGIAPNPQPHRATVTVGFPSGPIRCQVQVIVAEPERGTRTTGRSFLAKGKKEIPRFGLYSYLLMGSRPLGSARERYLAAVQAYLAGMDDVTKLQDYIPAAQLNVAYLPVETSPPVAVTAEWIVDHYDYARARALLQNLSGDLAEGPYIVSVLKPLAFDSHPSQYLFQNLSTVPTQPPDLISWWIRAFVHQAAQERFWEPKTAELLVLKMRTTISVLAIGLPDVQKSVSAWVSWVH